MQKLKSAQGNAEAPVTRFSQKLGEAALNARRVDLDIVQLARGATDGVMSGVMAGAGLVQKLRFPHEATIRTPQPKGQACFTLPLNDPRGWVVNGQRGEPGSMFFNIGLDETLIHAIDRESITGMVSRDVFRDYLAVLAGCDPDDVHPKAGNLVIGGQGIRQLVQDLSELIREDHGSEPITPFTATLEARIAHILASHAARHFSGRPLEPDPRRNPYRIVRQAYDYLDEAQYQPVLLGDLCRVTKVSAPTLIHAFQEVVGASPMRFHALQRLARVRQALLVAECHPGVVKAAALTHGFTQLGRFSALYRSIYDELPSDTVRRCAG